MAGSTTRTSRTTDCRRHDAGNTTGGAERPWRAPTHGSTHVSTGHVAEGGTSIACTMTRGSWRWERHIAPKTHRLMRALQQRHGTRGGSTYGGGRGGAAGGTGGGANGDSRDRGWNGTTYCGKWSDAGCGATISGGAGQEAESDDGATYGRHPTKSRWPTQRRRRRRSGRRKWSSRNWRRRRKRRRSASSRPANAASDPPNTDDSKLRQRQQLWRQRHGELQEEAAVAGASSGF